MKVSQFCHISYVLGFRAGSPWVGTGLRFAHCTEKLQVSSVPTLGMLRLLGFVFWACGLGFRSSFSGCFIIVFLWIPQHTTKDKTVLGVAHMLFSNLKA